jgi:hypothetical protein
MSKKTVFLVSKLALAATFGLALAFTFSCSGDDNGGSDTHVVRKEKISGVSQKGPFDAATVKIYELDANKNKTGNSFPGETDGDGKFEIKINGGTLASPYILLEVSGHYKNEVKGEPSNASITLYAVADVSDKDKVNINVFTHLEHERVLDLARKGTKFGDAKREAQKKVLNVLGLGESNVNSEDMSLFGSNANDKLLAASVLLQANRQTEDVENLLKKIIKDNGTLSPSTKAVLASGAEWVSSHIDEVTLNIKNIDPGAKVPSLEDINNIVEGINNPSLSGDVSSCISSKYPVCGENVPQAQCNEEGDTFRSATACEESYTYCLSLENNITCTPLGSAGKASCSADSSGIKTFTTKALCGGSKGSCRIKSRYDQSSLELCVDVNSSGLCDLYGDDDDVVTFQAGECSTEQYPCCLIDDEIEYFTNSFTKNNCYSIGGMPANAMICSFW